jgi:hypothetical protein
MEQSDIFPDEKDKSLLTAFAWWEKRRPAYNMVVGITGLVVLFFLGEFSLLTLAGVLLYGLVANVFYSTGFLLEVVDKHYFKSSLDISERKNELFWIGLLFSGLVTFGIGFVLLFIQAISV